MNNMNISNKILHWYDNNKRKLPWRYPKSKIQSQYYTLVSEIMLQQTQVSTVIPYFTKFVKEIPNLKSLSNIKEKKLLKLWEGLGYYSRAKNLKRAAQILNKNFNNELPNTIEELKSLPGVGDYTSRAILALEFNKKIIPIDGNIERLLKRVLFLKKESEISKNNLMYRSNFFGFSNRQREYVQALMEIGALVCKPNIPLCDICPINLECKAYRLKNFKVTKKLKINKTKYFRANIYVEKNKMLLIKNKKFNFLKNLLIFPMSEINRSEYNLSEKKKTKIKISNIDMKILINKKHSIPKQKGTILVSKVISKEIIPSFTKKLFKVALG